MLTPQRIFQTRHFPWHCFFTFHSCFYEIFVFCLNSKKVIVVQKLEHDMYNVPPVLRLEWKLTTLRNHVRVARVIPAAWVRTIGERRWLLAPLRFSCLYSRQSVGTTCREPLPEIRAHACIVEIFLVKIKMNVTKYLEQEVFLMGRAVLESKLKIRHGPPTTLGHLHQCRHRMLPFKNTQDIRACLQFRWSK